MEGFGGVRKKRSNVSRQPCSDPQKFSNMYSCLPISSQSSIRACNEEEFYSSERKVGSDGLKSENRPKKLKLKLGGITHTIHTKLALGSSPYFDFHQPQRNLIPQDQHLSGMQVESFYGNEEYRHETVRKSKRIPKRRVMDVGFDEDGDDADEEMRYLGRLNASKFTYVGRQMEYADTKNYRLSNSAKDGVPKLRSEQSCDDKDFMEDEEPISDDGEPDEKSKKLRFLERRNNDGASLIEFPNGLLPAPPKKEKVKLSEVEQQLKKAEAAQRRRMLSEKASREAEAEAIRKILGQDSARKKKEEKIKKQQEELAQGKAANSNTLGPNTVRWVIRPSGTVIVFSDDIGLPKIFNSAPCSYPPPREKCAGPNCTNTYKYRDSKSNLPLCSLFCYKAIH